VPMSVTKLPAPSKLYISFDHTRSCTMRMSWRTRKHHRVYGEIQIAGREIAV